MYPATPTPIPYATPVANITLPAWRVWTFADDTLTIWQMLGNTAHLVIQIVLLLLIFVVFVSALINWLRDLGEQS